MQITGNLVILDSFLISRQSIWATDKKSKSQYVKPFLFNKNTDARLIVQNNLNS